MARKVKHNFKKVTYMKMKYLLQSTLCECYRAYSIVQLHMLIMSAL